ncbi:MAG: DUF2062 domain-containing protein [Candidatus Omnitrophota bacterium]
MAGKFEKIKTTFISLLKLNNTPHGIALGVSLGAFIAIMPVYGFHTLLAVVAACLIPQANKLAILLGTNVSLPVTLPFITWGGYEIGRSILRGNYPVFSGAYFTSLSHLSIWGILQVIKNLYLPLFTGSLVLGIVCGIFFYIVVFCIVYLIKQKRA